MHSWPYESEHGYTLYSDVDYLQNPLAVAVIVHGYGEHCGRYLHVRSALNRLGVLTLGYDHFGHGRSPRLPGFIQNIGHLVDDLDGQVLRLQKQHAGRPLFIVAHSMGGMITLLWLLKYRRRVSGVVMSAPTIIINPDLSPLLRRIARGLAWAVPKLKIGDSADPSSYSRDPEIESRIFGDPHFYCDRMRVGTGAEILKGAVKLRQSLEKINQPFLILHGDDDSLASIEGSRTLYRHASSQDKSLTEFQGMRHEVFNEIDNQAVFDSMSIWIKERIHLTRQPYDGKST